MPAVREAVVDGLFYPAAPGALRAQIVDYLIGAGAADDAACAPKLLITPHAGYEYCGAVAAQAYALLGRASARGIRRVVLLGPAHRVALDGLAAPQAEAFETPLGRVAVDAAALATLDELPQVTRSDRVHEREHSLEVQLPFLQRLAGDFHFVPVALGTDRFAAFDELGKAIAEVIALQKEPVLIVASSDMNHYEDDHITRQKDRKALDKMLALDPRGLYDTVRREGITMCGFGPAVTLLTAALELGATEAELVRYATSGDITGDRDEVVGYAAVVVH